MLESDLTSFGLELLETNKIQQLKYRYLSQAPISPFDWKAESYK